MILVLPHLHLYLRRVNFDLSDKSPPLLMSIIKVSLICLFSLYMLSCATQTQHPEKNSQIDRISEVELAQILPQPLAMLSLDDLVKLTKEGVATEEIIEKIRMSNSFYDLTPSQIIELNKQGVDIKLLNYIHTSRELALRNNVADEINQRKKIARAELEQLKRQQWLQQNQHMYDPFCGYGHYALQPYGFPSYGYGAFGLGFSHYFGLGAGFARPLGCW